MSNKPTIKIVKRDERRRAAETQATLETNNAASADPTRKMVKTVTTWVREFKKKGDAEADKLLSTLIEKQPHPNEA